MLSFKSNQIKRWRVAVDDNSEMSKKPLDECCEYIYPVCPQGVISNKYWHLHQSIHWTAHEFDIMKDVEKFQSASKNIQKAILETAAVLMYGDGIVLDFLGLDALSQIKCMSQKAMFQDQTAREMVHADFYSKILMLDPNGYKLRENEERLRLINSVQNVIQKAKIDKNNLSEVLFFISLCEYILFAPLFMFVNYISTCNYCPTFCEGNLLVMRDEYIHYCHACELQTIMKNKIKLRRAIEFTNLFSEATKSMIDVIFKDLPEIYNMTIDHLNFIVHTFKKDNCLYADYDDELINEKKYGSTPAQEYMEMSKYEIKVNLMEVDPTIYKPAGAPATVTDMKFS